MSSAKCPNAKCPSAKCPKANCHVFAYLQQDHRQTSKTVNTKINIKNEEQKKQLAVKN